MPHPLVSISIPTRNSSKTLKLCLESILASTYPNIEIIVVDGNSTDNTVKIAEEYGAKVINCNWGLLGARYMGFMASRGSYILMLDSDQVLEPTTIERSIEAFKFYDMLVLEEMSYKPKTVIERLFHYDRELIHRSLSINPLTGEVLPRFFKRDLLERVFDAIPREAIEKLIHFDHAVIYYEAYKISKKVGIIPRAVWHLEVPTIKDMIFKNLRYGKSLVSFLKFKEYRALLFRDSLINKLLNRLKSKCVRSLKAFIASITLNAIKNSIISLGMIMGFMKSLGEVTRVHEAKGYIPKPLSLNMGMMTNPGPPCREHEARPGQLTPVTKRKRHQP